VAKGAETAPLQKDVAKKLEVSIRDAKRASKILREDPEVAELVKVGKSSLDDAERRIRSQLPRC